MSVLLEMSMGELNGERIGVFSIFQKGSRPKDIKPQKEDVQQTSKRPEKTLKSDNGKAKKSLSRTNQRSKAARRACSSGGDQSTISSDDHLELLDVDPNNSRRKRPKTASLDSKGQSMADTSSDSASLDAAVPSQTSSKTRFPTRPDSTCRVSEAQHKTLANNYYQAFKAESLADGRGSKAAGTTTSDLSKESSTALKHAAPSNPTTATSTIENKPKKVLKLNPKTGTIGSPPKKVIPTVDSTLKTPTGRGKKPKSKIVTIPYGPGQQLPPGVGAKIDQILGGAKHVASLPKVANAPKTAQLVPPKPPMSTHPFFLGKKATNPSSPPKSLMENVTSDLTETSSPRKLRPRMPERQPSYGTSSLPFSSGFANSAKTVKIPGAVEPAWPWKGMLHIRGNTSDSSPNDLLEFATLSLQTKVKKSKFNATRIPHIEDIMETMARDLHVGDIVESIQNIDPDAFPPIPRSLRPALKHNKSGIKIQRRVRKELHYQMLLGSHQAADSCSEDDISVAKSNQPKAHPSLLNIYSSIATSLSAFDRGQCDTQDWTHKYSPRCAAEVLQAGNEAMILKGWLQALTVNSVEGGLAEALRSRTSSLSRKAPKRKRKPNKLDGFVVSSGEEEFDPDEISEPDSESSSNKTRNRAKKTFVKGRAATDSGKLNNAILISGPCGSGKTATVYAVAKELGFEVFEISSNSRRNGKDIMDKVGDMTRNHLVHHSAVQAPVQPLNADEQRIDDALADDLKTGRQGTMNSFFKTKQTFQTKANPSKSLIERGPTKNKNATCSKQPAREQKQSLILIEEVDVLYKEDSQFWATITNLIQSSKRPIVMTCNDESVIEASSLALHGILRFTPSPTDLAVDYMLCLAACEGHVLERAAVQSLYETRHRDLRASIMDLNFWCQFGVGSIKGGLDWYLPRSPHGSDVDENGKTIRVISEGTYRQGMGCLSQDYLQSHMHDFDIEEKMLHEAWDGWQLDAADWQENLKLTTWANKMQRMSKGIKDHRATLSIYEEFAEAMSDADMYSHEALASGYRVPVGTMSPELKQKVLDDYVLPYKVLETSEPFNFNNIAQELSIWLRSRTRAYMQVDQHVKHGFEVPTELDRLAETDIIRLIQRQATMQDDNLSREDFDLAFEPISTPEKTYVWNAPSPAISVFNGNLAPIVEDIAPYVRSIVAYDVRLAQDRARLSNLLSEGGTRGKRIRTTRAAMSALEGGARKTTRREKYFDAPLNSYLVAGTGMQSWIDTLVASGSDLASSHQSRRSSNATVEAIASASKDKIAESST